MLQNVDDYVIALESAPECARRIAIILGLFVQIEHSLAPILSWVADMPLDQAQASLALQKQNARKVTFLQGLCDGISPEWPRDIEVGREFAAAARTAIRIRNKYAHAAYSLMGEQGSESLHVAIFADTAVREEIATIELLDTEIRFLKSVIVAMSNYVEARTANTPANLQEIQGLLAMAPQPFLRNPVRES